MRIALLTFGIIQILLTLQLSLYNAVEFKLTNAECTTFNKSWVLIDECIVITGKNNKNIFNFNGSFLHPANKIDVHLQVLKKAKGYKPWLYNITIDACRFVKKPYNPVAILISKLFIEYTNFNHTCPYVGPQIVKGFYLRSNILPHPMPTGEYKLALNFILSKRLQFSVDAFFEFSED